MPQSRCQYFIYLLNVSIAKKTSLTYTYTTIFHKNWSIQVYYLKGDGPKNSKWSLKLILGPLLTFRKSHYQLKCAQKGMRNTKKFGKPYFCKITMKFKNFILKLHCFDEINYNTISTNGKIENMSYRCSIWSYNNFILTI